MLNFHPPPFLGSTCAGGTSAPLVASIAGANIRVTSCPAGTYPATAGGTTFNAAGTACITCPAGYTCAGGIVDKAACAGTGTLQASAPGQTVCSAYTACAAGSYLVTSPALTTYSATGTGCVPCPAGE